MKITFIHPVTLSPLPQSHHPASIERLEEILSQYAKGEIEKVSELERLLWASMYFACKVPKEKIQILAKLIESGQGTEINVQLKRQLVPKHGIYLALKEGLAAIFIQDFKREIPPFLKVSFVKASQWFNFLSSDRKQTRQMVADAALVNVFDVWNRLTNEERHMLRTLSRVLTNKLPREFHFELLTTDSRLLYNSHHDYPNYGRVANSRHRTYRTISYDAFPGEKEALFSLILTLEYYYSCMNKAKSASGVFFIRFIDSEDSQPLNLAEYLSVYPNFTF